MKKIYQVLGQAWVRKLGFSSNSRPHATDYQVIHIAGREMEKVSQQFL